MALAPIWRDYNVSLGSAASRDYTIRLGSAAGAILFAGRAYRRPGAATISVRINDVCADYIAATLPRSVGGKTLLQGAATFVVEAGGAAIDTVTFYNDWSYDPDFNPATMSLADPVDGLTDPRQRLFYTALPGTASVTAVITYGNGDTQSVPLTIYAAGDFNGDFNADFNVAGAGDGGTAVLDLQDYAATAALKGGFRSVVIGDTLYPVTAQPCHDYAAYYVNAYGGWDTLLLGGSTTLRDNLERFTMAKDYDNGDLSARGRKDYAIEVTPAWTLRTGILADDQSLRMHHLLNSPEVYLCELATGRFTPVLLTDLETPRKTYNGDGRRVAQYAFAAELAQQRFRR